MNNLLITRLFLLSSLMFAVHAGGDILPPNNQTKQNHSIVSQARQEQLLHLLRQDCGSCHGMQLSGGLGPALLPHTLQQHSVDTITSTILYGRPTTAMPPWQGILSESDAHWIARQLIQGVSADE